MARDTSTGRMVADPNKFPSGLATLATEIHNLGLKIGIYRFVPFLFLLTC
jgi:alpha-galactosidase